MLGVYFVLQLAQTVLLHVLLFHNSVIHCTQVISGLFQHAPHL